MSKIGTFSVIDGVVTAEILSGHLDFLVLDSEHGLESLSEQRARLLACQDSCEVFIRPPSLSRINIQKCLELNADGILVPQIADYSAALECVDYSFYPPIGTRGVSPSTRPFNYDDNNVDDKKQAINKGTQLCLLIEGPKAFSDLNRICCDLSSHIHMIYFGLFDFANASNLQADWNLEELQNKLQEIVNLCSKNGIQVGTIARKKEDITLLQSFGIDYIVYRNDSAILGESLKTLTK